MFKIVLLSDSNRDQSFLSFLYVMSIIINRNINFKFCLFFVLPEEGKFRDA